MTQVKKKRKRKPKGYWTPERQRETLDRVGKQLGIAEFSDWYGVTRKEVSRLGGAALLRSSHSNLQELLRNVYNEYSWDPKRFVTEGRLPRGFSLDQEKMKAEMDRIEKTLGITQPEDWFTVKLSDLIELGFPRSVGTLKLVDLLKQRYPGYQWETLYLTKGRYAQQKRVERAIAALFPGVELKVNVRSEGGIVNPETGAFLELDFYLPSLKLAIEFQEKHHFTSAAFSNKPVDMIKKRDKMKIELAAIQGITLIAIPFWWDGELGSLAATIKQARPDLANHMTKKGVKEDSSPIPEEPPAGVLDKHVVHIEDIGEPTNPCFFVGTQIDPAGWWMFEKYDGVRGFWNPLKKAFYTRKGNKYTNFPPEVLDTMPDMFLDGELWFGRENFQETSKISNRSDPSMADWSKFKYMVFDLPTSKDPYAQRYATLANALADSPCKFISVAPYELCKDMSHLESFFQDVIDKGGEGIILRDPAALLEPGRSLGYLKHKKFRDAEARVVGSSGSFRWECELPNGVKFTATPGTTEFARRWSPQPGDIVTFKHHGFLLASQKPKLPTLYRLRMDLTWEDVVNNWKEQKRVVDPTKVMPLRRKSEAALYKKGHWKKLENRRKFFLEIAEEMGFDPYKAENWYSVTVRRLQKKKVGGLLGMYKGLYKALENTFPELKFEEQTPKGYWSDVDNRRKFFLELAKEKGFDPLVPENWDQVTTADILAKKGGALFGKFGGLKGALKATFTEIPFEAKIPKGYWLDIEHRKQFFLGLAKEFGFDPKVPENWRQKVTAADLLTRPGGSVLLRLYGGLKNALQQTFPDVEFQVRPRFARDHWSDIANRKQFFSQLADEIGFDKSVGENWSQITHQQVVNRGGTELLVQFDGVHNALNETFPELNIPTKKQPKGYWDDIENRKSFFIKFAEDHGFDPYDPNGWETVTAVQIKQKCGGMLTQFNGLANALARTLGIQLPSKKTKAANHI